MITFIIVLKFDQFKFKFELKLNRLYNDTKCFKYDIIRLHYKITSVVIMYFPFTFHTNNNNARFY